MVGIVGFAHDARLSASQVGPVGPRPVNDLVQPCAAGLVPVPGPDGAEATPDPAPPAEPIGSVAFWAEALRHEREREREPGKAALVVLAPADRDALAHLIEAATAPLDAAPDATVAVRTTLAGLQRRRATHVTLLLTDALARELDGAETPPGTRAAPGDAPGAPGWSEIRSVIGERIHRPGTGRVAAPGATDVVVGSEGLDRDAALGELDQDRCATSLRVRALEATDASPRRELTVLASTPGPARFVPAPPSAPTGTGTARTDETGTATLTLIAPAAADVEFRIATPPERVGKLSCMQDGSALETLADADRFVVTAVQRGLPVDCEHRLAEVEPAPSGTPPTLAIGAELSDADVADLGSGCPAVERIALATAADTARSASADTARSAPLGTRLRLCVVVENRGAVTVERLTTSVAGLVEADRPSVGGPTRLTPGERHLFEVELAHDRPRHLTVEVEGWAGSEHTTTSAGAGLDATPPSLSVTPVPTGCPQDALACVEVLNDGGTYLDEVAVLDGSASVVSLPSTRTLAPGERVTIAMPEAPTGTLRASARSVDAAGNRLAADRVASGIDELTLHQVASRDSVEPGETVSFDITIVGGGDSADGGPRLSHSLCGDLGPATERTLDDGDQRLEPGEVWHHRCAARIDDDTVAVVEATGDRDGPSTRTTVRVDRPDIGVRKRQRSDLRIGSETLYELTVQNIGSADAADVVVVDPLPDGVDFVAAESTKGSCSHAAGTVTCQLGTLAFQQGSETDLISIRVKARAGTVGQIVTNEAKITSSTTDRDTFDNTSKATGEVKDSDQCDDSTRDCGPAAAPAVGPAATPAPGGRGPATRQPSAAPLDTGGTGPLARTGAEQARLLAWALVIAAAGVSLRVAGRRREVFTAAVG